LDPISLEGNLPAQADGIKGITGIGIGTARERLGIAPHLAVNQNAAWIAFAALEGRVKQHTVTIDRFARLFPIGGTLCITLRLSRAGNQLLGTSAIQDLLSLTERRTDTSGVSVPMLMIKGEKAEISLYGLFQQTVQALCTSLQAHWLDFDPETRIMEAGSDSQSPWVVTAAEVDGEVRRAFCTSGAPYANRALDKSVRIKPYEHDIAPLLFRSVSTEFELEPAYIDPMGDTGLPGLTNLNLDARLFVLMSRRSVLCLTGSLEEDPAHYFLPGLLDICETVRARWHVLIVMNRMLDASLNLLQTGVTPEKKLEELVRMRGWTARSLDDPGIYIVAGEALSRIYEQLQQTFRVAELRTYLFDKVNLLERMHRDRLQLDWFRALPT
jgi:hypothetical protein